MGVRLSVQLPTAPQVLRGAELSRLVELARLAEDAGVDQLSVSDHVVMADATERYPHGTFPNTAQTPYPEPLTLLSAVAAVTTRLELSTSVLVAPLRPAALLAKTCATLDALSGGRLVLGVGTGWQEEEFAAVGVPLAERGQRLTDTIAACRALWRDSPATFASSTVGFDAVRCEPRPHNPDSIRVWFGGGATRRTVERVARLGHGWIPLPATRPEAIAAGVERLRAGLAEAGRGDVALDVKAVLPAVGDGDGPADLDRSLENVPVLAASGATVVHVLLNGFVASLDEVPGFLERLVERFAPLRDAAAADHRSAPGQPDRWPAAPWRPPPTAM